jgi:hypothetical protein
MNGLCWLVPLAERTLALARERDVILVTADLHRA